MVVSINKSAYFERIEHRPLAWQHKFHTSAARFRIAVCGRRSGKSNAGGRDIQPKLLIPEKRYWIVGPTYELGEKEFRVIWNDMMVKLGLGKDKRIKRAYSLRTGDMKIEFPWNTSIEVKSADHPERLVGEALDGVIMSEAAKHKKETWERYIRPALADRRGFADFLTTPEGFNWIYQIWQYGQNPDEQYKDFESWSVPSWANTEVFPGGREDPEIKLVEVTTSEEWFRQEYGADFASFVGRIYAEWDEQEHVRKHVFNPEWPNYMAFDWGWNDPLAAIEFQVSPDDTVYIWREHYARNKTLEEHLAILKDRNQPDGYRLDLAFGDAADPEAATYVSQNLVPCLALQEAKAGNGSNGQSKWRQGVNCVSRFMKMRDTGLVDEYEAPILRPHLYVDHSCVNVIREFNNYRAPEPVKGKNVPDFGKKIDDHAMDAIRYAFLSLFELGAGSHLTEAMVGGNSSMPIETITDYDARGFFTTNGMSF